MNYSLVDSKLKSLIRVCKKTGNDKKLAVVSFILTSNLLDEIGIKLGIRPRDKDIDETIFRYMTLINSVLKMNLKIVLFRDLTGAMSTLFLITYGASAFFFILYWNYYKKEESV